MSVTEKHESVASHVCPHHREPKPGMHLWVCRTLNPLGHPGPPSKSASRAVSQREPTCCGLGTNHLTSAGGPAGTLAVWVSQGQTRWSGH